MADREGSPEALQCSTWNSLQGWFAGMSERFLLRGFVQLQGCSVGDLVDVFERQWVGRFGPGTVDRTGLRGRYNLELQWRPANLASSAASQDARRLI